MTRTTRTTARVLLGLVTTLCPAVAFAAPTVSVLDTVPGATGLMPSAPFAFGDAAFFRGTASGVTGLWRTEGTSASTAMVTALPSANGSAMGAVSGGFVFVAGDSMYRSDGTAAGTKALTTFARPPGTTASGYRFIGSTGAIAIFFAGYDGATSTMIRSDGTAAGTYRIGSPNDVTSPLYLGSVVADGYIYYADAANSRLRRSDGNVVEIVCNMDPSVHPFTGCGGKTFYVPLVGGPGTLFATSAAGPVNLGEAANTFGCTGSKLVFSRGANEELWVTDGTMAGTTLLRTDVHLRGSKPLTLTASGATAFVAVSTAPSTFELWASDGSVAGTTRLSTLPGSGVLLLGATPGHAYFYDGSHALFDYEGTSVRTVVAAGMTAGAAGAVRIGTRLVSTTNTLENGPELWVLDDPDGLGAPDAGGADGSAPGTGPGTGNPEGGAAGSTPPGSSDGPTDGASSDGGADASGDDASSGCATGGVGARAGGGFAALAALVMAMVGARRSRRPS